MPIPDDVREITPGRVFREGDKETLYWVRDGRILYRHHPVRGADAESFRFYRGSFGKDREHCYIAGVRLSGGIGTAFRALNYTYATDGVSVWTLGGQVKDADAASFVVCDDGSHLLGTGIRVPHGFGKDASRVFYFDFDGKPNRVRKATPASFVSLNDGHFGLDADFVFCGTATLPKAVVARWRKLGGFYSGDDRRVYYYNGEIREADRASFEVVLAAGEWTQLARDRRHLYHNGQIVDDAEFYRIRKMAEARGV